MMTAKQDMSVKYWVLTKADEKTVATTRYEEVAKWIAENFKEECVIRVTFS